MVCKCPPVHMQTNDRLTRTDRLTQELTQSSIHRQQRGVGFTTNPAIASVPLATHATSTIPDLDAIKAKQKATWESGDFGQIARTIENVAEDFMEAYCGQRVYRALGCAAGCGTGSSPDPPHGWQRQIRFTPSHDPRHTPCNSHACRK